MKHKSNLIQNLNLIKIKNQRGS